MLLGKYPNSCAAARALSMRSHSHVRYYVKLWEDSDVQRALLQAESAEGCARQAAPQTVQASAPPAPAATRQRLDDPAAHLRCLEPMPLGMKLNCTHSRQVFLALQAVKYMRVADVGSRRATKVILDFYRADRGTASISHATVMKYCDSHYRPVAHRKASYLPEQFGQQLCSSWILAIRSLNFPVFKDMVLGQANALLCGTSLLQQYKHSVLGTSWYKRFMRRFAHVLDTANQLSRWRFAAPSGRPPMRGEAKVGVSKFEFDSKDLKLATILGSPSTSFALVKIIALMLS